MFRRVLGFCLGLIAPLVMLLASVLAIPDYLRVRRMQRM